MTDVSSQIVSINFVKEHTMQNGDTASDLDRFKEEFPKMLSRRPISFDVAKGWEQMVRTLFALIQFRCDHVGCPQVVVKQVKEKLGGLRVYISGGDDVIQGMIAFAEAMSEMTCIFCGNPGHRRQNSWIHPACDCCEEKYRHEFSDD